MLKSRAAEEDWYSKALRKKSEKSKKSKLRKKFVSFKQTFSLAR